MAVVATAEGAAVASMAVVVDSVEAAFTAAASAAEDPVAALSAGITGAMAATMAEATEDPVAAGTARIEAAMEVLVVADTGMAADVGSPEAAVPTAVCAAVPRRAQAPTGLGVRKAGVSVTPRPAGTGFKEAMAGAWLEGRPALEWLADRALQG